MLLKNRLYQKKAPSKDAKLILIYCEGEKRETQYFAYFMNISSRIRLEVVPRNDEEDYTPTGLYQKAESQLINHSIYDLSKDDEVWFVIDTDRWGKKIKELKKGCAKYPHWRVAQSNPCFEVWLFYHCYPFEEFQKIKFPRKMKRSKQWKIALNEKVSGGFHSQRHPINILEAIKNSKEKNQQEKDEMNIGCTEMYQLAESFYPFIEKYLNQSK